MNIFGQFVTIFHRKKPAVVPETTPPIKNSSEEPAPTEVPSEVPSDTRSPTEQTTPTEQTSPIEETAVIKKENRVSRVSSIQPDKLEFEASRRLLVDFPEDDMHDLTFPSFEHLLLAKKKKVVSIEEHTPSMTQSSVYRRFSLYRPIKARIKRAKSTPNFQ